MGGGRRCRFSAGEMNVWYGVVYECMRSRRNEGRMEDMCVCARDAYGARVTDNTIWGR